jgi:DNA polymerase III alpha subunit
MEELFVYAPQAYENTERIAHMIDLELDVGGYKIPKFPLSHEEKIQYKTFLHAQEPRE